MSPFPAADVGLKGSLHAKKGAASLRPETSIEVVFPDPQKFFAEPESTGTNPLPDRDLPRSSTGGEYGVGNSEIPAKRPLLRKE